MKDCFDEELKIGDRVVVWYEEYKEYRRGVIEDMWDDFNSPIYVSFDDGSLDWLNQDEVVRIS